ncbi:hypothetical protein BC833DRAFT_626717 [Globomyces pollinis-pini]|nr:hypothetical protein BC833DRAFT_626717 [Globomyces pollinis-pini]
MAGEIQCAFIFENQQEQLRVITAMLDENLGFGEDAERLTCICPIFVEDAIEANTRLFVESSYSDMKRKRSSVSYRFHNELCEDISSDTDPGTLEEMNQVREAQPELVGTSATQQPHLFIPSIDDIKHSTIRWQKILEEGLRQDACDICDEENRRDLLLPFPIDDEMFADYEYLEMDLPRVRSARNVEYHFHRIRADEEEYIMICEPCRKDIFNGLHRNLV